MKKSLLLICVALSFTACKLDESNDPKNDPIYRPDYGGMEEPRSKMFTYPEVQIGKRICDVLETKKKMLSTYEANEKMQLIFVGNARVCGAANQHIQDSEFSVYVDLVGLNYEFVAPLRSEYFKDIITKDSVVMGEVCEALNQTGEVSRQFAINSSNIIVKFLVKDSMDRVEISQYSPAAGGGFKLANVEGISFISTTKHGPPALFGLEKERSRFTTCPDSRMAPAYLKQNWINLTTTL